MSSAAAASSSSTSSSSDEVAMKNSILLSSMNQKDVEKLLNEKLYEQQQRQWTLMTFCCPVCSSPVVKSSSTSFKSASSTKASGENGSSSSSSREDSSLGIPAALISRLFRKANEINELLPSMSTDYQEGEEEEIMIGSLLTKDKDEDDESNNEKMSCCTSLSRNTKTKTAMNVIAGIPYCVSCESHVVTDESMLAKVTAIQEQWDDETGRSAARRPILLVVDSGNGKAVNEEEEEEGVEVEEEEEEDELVDDVHAIWSRKSYDMSEHQAGSSAAIFVSQSERSCSLVMSRIAEEEEGFEQNIDEYISTLGSMGTQAAYDACLPPYPMDSDLLRQEEKDEMRRAIEMEKALRRKRNNLAGGDDMSDAVLEEEILQEYEYRRNIASKILTEKMLLGHSLLEAQCLKCGMPLMKHPTPPHSIDCVVCPVLVTHGKNLPPKQRSLKTQQIQQEHEANVGLVLDRKTLLEAHAEHQRRDEQKKRLNDQAMIEDQLKKIEEESKARIAQEQIKMQEEERTAYLQAEKEKERMKKVEEEFKRLRKEEQDKRKKQEKEALDLAEQIRLKEEARLAQENSLPEEASLAQEEDKAAQQDKEPEEAAEEDQVTKLEQVAGPSEEAQTVEDGTNLAASEEADTQAPKATDNDDTVTNTKDESAETIISEETTTEADQPASSATLETPTENHDEIDATTTKDAAKSMSRSINNDDDDDDDDDDEEAEEVRLAEEARLAAEQKALEQKKKLEEYKRQAEEARLLAEKLIATDDTAVDDNEEVNSANIQNDEEEESDVQDHESESPIEKKMETNTATSTDNNNGAYDAVMKTLVMTTEPTNDDKSEALETAETIPTTTSDINDNVITEHDMTLEPRDAHPESDNDKVHDINVDNEPELEECPESTSHDNLASNDNNCPEDNHVDKDAIDINHDDDEHVDSEAPQEEAVVSTNDIISKEEESTYTDVNGDTNIGHSDEQPESTDVTLDNNEDQIPIAETSSTADNEQVEECPDTLNEEAEVITPIETTHDAEIIEQTTKPVEDELESSPTDTNELVEANTNDVSSIPETTDVAEENITEEIPPDTNESTVIIPDESSCIEQKDADSIIPTITTDSHGNNDTIVNEDKTLIAQDGNDDKNDEMSNDIVNVENQSTKTTEEKDSDLHDDQQPIVDSDEKIAEESSVAKSIKSSVIGDEKTTEELSVAKSNKGSVHGDEKTTEELSVTKSIKSTMKENGKTATEDTTDDNCDAKVWETMLSESRSRMTKRMLNGWTILADYCMGSQCKYSPLMKYKDKPKECVVCGGSGSGEDGAYLTTPVPVPDEPEETQEDDDEIVSLPASLPPIVQISAPVDEDDDDDASLPTVRSIITTDTTRSSSITAPPETEADYRACRSEVSREIGRRMLAGWVLRDDTCPFCIMPLMSEVKEGLKQCVLCGNVEELLEEKAKEEVKNQEMKDQVMMQRSIIEEEEENGENPNPNPKVALEDDEQEKEERVTDETIGIEEAVSCSQLINEVSSKTKKVSKEMIDDATKENNTDQEDNQGTKKDDNEEEEAPISSICFSYNSEMEEIGKECKEEVPVEPSSKKTTEEETSPDVNENNDGDEDECDLLLEDDPEVIKLQMAAHGMSDESGSETPVETLRNDDDVVMASPSVPECTTPVAENSVNVINATKTTTPASLAIPNLSTNSDMSCHDESKATTCSNDSYNNHHHRKTKSSASFGMGIRDMSPSSALKSAASLTLSVSKSLNQDNSLRTNPSRKSSRSRHHNTPSHTSCPPRPETMIAPPSPSLRHHHLLHHPQQQQQQQQQQQHIPPSPSRSRHSLPSAIKRSFNPTNCNTTTDDASELSDDYAEGRTIATDTLRVILNKIAIAKAQLLIPPRGDSAASIKEHLANQIETAQLIEKLASAAVAIRNMEDLEDK